MNKKENEILEISNQEDPIFKPDNPSEETISFEQFEEEVKNIVNNYYGAPSDITRDINEFLFESGNIYSIYELARAVKGD